MNKLIDNSIGNTSKAPSGSGEIADGRKKSAKKKSLKAEQRLSAQRFLDETRHDFLYGELGLDPMQVAKIAQTMYEFFHLAAAKTIAAQDPAAESAVACLRVAVELVFVNSVDEDVDIERIINGFEDWKSKTTPQNRKVA